MTAYPVPDVIFEQHSAWLATSGAGKTTAVKGGVERMLGRGERVVIIDPTGVWWGLRFLADGRRTSPFKIVIFGREHADLPIEEGSGEAIARAIGGSSTSAILSLKGMRVAERTRFITDFFETLAAANTGLLHLMIDEVHLFAPQQGGTGLTPAMLHATNNLVSLGRAAGLRIAMISQRPAKVHKDSLTQAKSLVALQCSHPLDQRPVRDWLSTSITDKTLAAEIMQSLSGLQVGEGWLSAPQLGRLERITFPMIRTFDSSKPGVEEIPLKPLDVAALRAALTTSDLPPTDRSKIGSPPLADRRASAAEPADAEARGYQAGYSAGYADGRAAGRHDAVTALSGLLETMRCGLDDAPQAETASLAAQAPVSKRPEKQRTSRPAPVVAARPDTAGDLTPALQRVLDALGWWHAAGHRQVARARACVNAGYSPRASTFGVYVSDLVKRGLVASGGGKIGLTEAGVKRANLPRHASWTDLRESARALLKPQETRVFDVVYEASPNSVRRDAVATALGLSTTASTIGVYIGAVAAYGLIEPAGPGLVRAAPWLFGMGGGDAG